MTIEKYTGMYRDNLLDDVIPFWMKHSSDSESGGYFTCLDRQGKVYDTDKFVWLQGRQVWTFSMLYNRVEKRKEWLDFAIHGAAFLRKYGRDDRGNWYFSLTREGRPLVQPYNIFSDCFACMGFGQLHKATGDEAYREIARKTFDNILLRIQDPKGKYSKAYPGTRPMQTLSIPMILSNLILEVEDILGPDLVDRYIRQSLDTVMKTFYDPKSGLVLENVGTDGAFLDCFEGRLVMPGHSLESMWFLMDLAERTGDAHTIRQAVNISLNLLEFGWDKHYGGIYYMLDIQGKPTQQLEYDQKLWWVHLEAIVCMLKGYLHTGEERCWQWFEKLHQYTWDRFPDPQFGEWYGYLNRRGELLYPAKGGKWKGCFHVPRCLYQGWKTLEAIGQQTAARQENNR